MGIMRILMTPELTRVWQRPLYMAGFDIVTCPYDRDTLLRATSLEAPDIILLNALLFGLDAATAARALCAMPLTKMPALLALFPGSPEEAMTRAEEAGAIVLCTARLTAEGLTARCQSLALHDRLLPDFARPERVERALRALSISEKSAAFCYLAEAVALCARDQDCFRKLSRLVYPEIGQKYNTAPTSVERLIRHAIESAWLRGDMEQQYALFGNTVDEQRGKPTNGEFIARVTEALRLEAIL